MELQQQNTTEPQDKQAELLKNLLCLPELRAGGPSGVPLPHTLTSLTSDASLSLSLEHIVGGVFPASAAMLG